MSDTPETDAAERMAYSQEYMVPPEVARQLERERNSARKLAQAFHNDQVTLLIERDEAREALADWENASAHVEADHPDEVHCGCVPVLRKLLADARKERERDEAREVARGLAAQAERLKRERDEARDRYNELLGVKKVPKWYNGREIPITAQEAAK